MRPVSVFPCLSSACGMYLGNAECFFQFSEGVPPVPVCDQPLSALNPCRMPYFFIASFATLFMLIHYISLASLYPFRKGWVPFRCRVQTGTLFSGPFSIIISTMHKKILAFACMLFAAGFFALAQPRPGGGRYDELLAFIGFRLDELIARFGAPRSVHAARGEMEWQDDVVFVYPQGDFYIYRDRVWQVGFNSIYGMRVGDPGAVAHLVLGEGARDYGDFIVYQLYPLPGTGWPVALRVNISAGRISAIFVYRTDF